MFAAVEEAEAVKSSPNPSLVREGSTGVCALGYPQRTGTGRHIGLPKYMTRS
jgi:hypothetical protein